MSTSFCWKYLFSCDTKEEMEQELKKLEAKHCNGGAFHPRGGSFTRSAVSGSASIAVPTSMLRSALGSSARWSSRTIRGVWRLLSTCRTPTT
eukprot:86989-Rhodomonas_salina.2